MIRRQWQQELFAERSFGALYAAARTHVGVKSNNLVALAIFAIAALPLLASFLGVWPPVSVAALAVGIRLVLNLGVQFATSILGFLVSGFALFFAITRSDVLVLLAGIDHEKGNISRLQFILYSFMYVFIHYIVYLGVTLALSVCIAQGSVLNDTIRYWKAFSSCAFHVAEMIVFAGLAAWLVFILMLLKSFIWNLFQTVLVAITVGADMDSGRLSRVIAELKKAGEGD